MGWHNFADFSKSRMCQNAEKIITETENSRKMKIAEISISQKKIKLPKMFLPEITNSRNLKSEFWNCRTFKFPKIVNWWTLKFRKK